LAPAIPPLVFPPPHDCRQAKLRWIPLGLGQAQLGPSARMGTGAGKITGQKARGQLSARPIAGTPVSPSPPKLLRTAGSIGSYVGFQTNPPLPLASAKPVRCPGKLSGEQPVRQNSGRFRRDPNGRAPAWRSPWALPKISCSGPSAKIVLGVSGGRQGPGILRPLLQDPPPIPALPASAPGPSRR